MLLQYYATLSRAAIIARQRSYMLDNKCVSASSIMYIGVRMLRQRRRRFCTIIIFIAMASCVFLFFQLFSFEVLTARTKKQPHADSVVLHTTSFVKDNCGSDGCRTSKEGDYFKMEIVMKHGDAGGHGGKYQLAKHITRQKQLPQVVVAHNDIAHVDVKVTDALFMSARRPRGVPPEMSKLYLPDSQNHFTCIQSKQQIAFVRVNDDYCDCSDSSDEPGTSACPDSRFYCTVPIAMVPGRAWVPASKVNDGICDCCDGSDEWRNVSVMDSIKFKDSEQESLDVYQTPCHNRCTSVQALRSRADVVRLQGLRVKKAYIALAGKKNGYDAKHYGPEGVFYLLSDICYQFDTENYHYTVCPFRDVKQKKLADSSSHILGRQSSWLDDGANGQYRLKMEGGDSIQCPNSKSRSTIIKFVCGIKDHVISVREDEVCVYLVKFSTPAACQG